MMEDMFRNDDKLVVWEIWKNWLPSRSKDFCWWNGWLAPIFHPTSYIEQFLAFLPLSLTCLNLFQKKNKPTKLKWKKPKETPWKVENDLLRTWCFYNQFFCLIWTGHGWNIYQHLRWCVLMKDGQILPNNSVFVIETWYFINRSNTIRIYLWREKLKNASTTWTLNCSNKTVAENYQKYK